METVVATNSRFLATFADAVQSPEIFLVSVALHPSISPGPADEFWLEHAGHRGAIRMSVYDILRDWWSAFNYSVHGGASSRLSNIPNVQIIFGPDGDWAIYSNMAWDLAVLGTMGPLPEGMIAGIQYIHDAAWAEGYWLNQGSVMKAEFYNTFRSNYGNPATDHMRQVGR